MDEIGEWSVDRNEDDTGIVLAFNHVGDNGVEVYETSMPPAHALTFATAVLNQVLELQDDRPVTEGE